MSVEERATSAEPSAPGFGRAGVAAAATLVPTLLLVHALAAAIHARPGVSPGAVVVSCAVIAVGAAHALGRWRLRRVPAWGWAVVPLAAALLLIAVMGIVAGAFSVAVCGTVQGWAQSRLAVALPATIDDRLGARPWRAVGWSLLAVLAVVQTARLASHQADPQVAWWVTTRNPGWTSHQCAAMYVFGADLQRQGETNLYADEHFPPFEDPEAEPRTTVENLASHLECGFEYPPPFLPLPLALLRFTNDFHVFRPVWFALNGLAFLAAAVALCLWIGGPRGRLALWLLPAVWCAVPTLQTFQFGQFHLTAFALALGGLLALETRRTSLGGALLGAAVVTKIFPGVLVLLLASQRRWRELLVTALWMAGFVVASLALLGTAPFQAFLSYKLPRILDGSAFITPADGDGLVAILTGITALPWRLRILGLEFLPTRLGTWMGYALALGIVLLVVRVGRRTMGRAQAATLWLALLNLTVLQGPAAFSDYTTATYLWLLSFVAVEMTRSRAMTIVLWIAWLHLATLIGTFPIPDQPTGDDVISARVVAASTLLMTGIALGLGLWCASRDDPEASAAWTSRR